MDKVMLLHVITKVAFVLTIAAFASGIPTCLKIWKNRSTGANNPAPFLSLMLSCCLWLRYGLLIQDDNMVTINVVGLIFAIAYSLVFLVMADKISLALKNLFITIVLIAFIVTCAASSSDMIFFSGLAACVSSVVTSASPLAGLGEVMRTKSTESLPFLMIVLGFMVNLVWFIYGVLVGDTFVSCQNLICFAFCSGQLALFAIYPSKSDAKKKV